MFLLAVAAPSAQAAKSAETKANLCKFILTLGWPAAESVNEMCEKVGVPLSVFPNAASGGYDVSTLAANLEAAQDYYDKVKKDYEEKEKKLSELKDKLASNPDFGVAHEIQAEIDKIQKEMDADKEKLAECEKNKKYWEDQLTMYKDYDGEDWETKMLPRLKDTYNQLASKYKSDAAIVDNKLADVEKWEQETNKKYQDELARIAKLYGIGEIDQEKYEKWKSELENGLKNEQENYANQKDQLAADKDKYLAEAAKYENLATNATAADAKTYYTNEATINAQSAANSYDEVVAHQNKLASEVASQNDKFDEVASHSGMTSEGMHNLVNEYNDVESAYLNAYNDLQGAEKELNAAQQAYNNAQGGSSGEDCWYEKQCEKKCEKKCWKDENGDEKCEESCWDECEEVKVCK